MISEQRGSLNGPCRMAGSGQEEGEEEEKEEEKVTCAGGGEHRPPLLPALCDSGRIAFCI